MMITNNQHKDNTGVYIFIATVAVLVILAFTSCSSERKLEKAKQKFAKIAITYPLIPANYCAITYPIKDSIIKDTLITTDTVLFQGGETFDTLVMFDTIRITRTIQLPGKVITNTIHVTDTIIKESTAKLQACQLGQQATLNLLTESEKERKIAQGKAKTRGIVMWSFIALIICYSAWKVYNIFKPKIKTI